MKTTLLVLAFTFIASISFAQMVTEKAIKPGEEEIQGQQMHISVLDAQSGKPVSVDVRVSGINRKPTVFAAVSDTLLPIKTYRLFNVSCLKQGYMYYSHKFWPEEKHIHEEQIILKPLKVGLKTEIREITFLGDQTEIYTKSTEALDDLVEFLNMHPGMTMAIIGHVNGPDKEKGHSFYKKASLKRAESVVQYLVEKGIAKERLEARGAGNTEMVYVKPQTDWQSDANRRIEIEILHL